MRNSKTGGSKKKKMDLFYLDEYLEETRNDDAGTRKERKKLDFTKLCAEVKETFIKEWESQGNADFSSVTSLQKRAIIGYANETSYFKEKIKRMIGDFHAEATLFPTWYQSLEDAVFHENWGIAGLAEWFSQSYGESSSAKIIGERIYFLTEGRMKQMPQTISEERKEQLIRSFLLLTPEERLDKEFHEVYLLDGTRITVFRGSMTKPEQDAIIFRRYIVPQLSFEEQAARGTIPAEAIPLFEAMVGVGFNVVFLGQIRSAKTTFLSTWQSYEDPMLEGVLVETDPEIPMHHLMPKAPVLQLLADDERLSRISKNLLRSDADYFILAEARDGNALDTAIRIAGKGTRRMKMTFHCGEPLDFPYDAAFEIVRSVGGDLDLTAQKVAASFDYIFHFVQLKNKNEKRLHGIYELSFDRTAKKIEIQRICTYNFRTDGWTFQNYFSERKRNLAEEESIEKAMTIDEELERLSRQTLISKRKDLRI